MTSRVFPPAGAGLARPAQYYFSPCFRQGEPRVVLLVGNAWRPNLRVHYGIDEAPFFSREAYAGEPDHYPNRHPWGWVFRPEKVLPYERASGRMAAGELLRLEAAIQEQLTGLPFAESAGATAAVSEAQHTIEEYA